MINKEFQELKARLFQTEGSAKEVLIGQMRELLKARNNDSSFYTNAYTHKGKDYNIDTCSVEELFEIDGDMCPLGI